MTTGFLCRACGSGPLEPILDLGMHPPSESFLSPAHVNDPEVFYPLTVVWCRNCSLLQLDVTVDPGEIFDDYAYFSSYSTSWVSHAERLVDSLVERFSLHADTLIVEIASNDGYLLQHVLARGLKGVGIEPSRTVAEAAIEASIPTIQKFFDATTVDEILAQLEQRADVIIANNVLAQVPSLQTFIAGLPRLLAPHGVVTIEVPHVMRLLADLQFDTVYHEHYSYFSLHAIDVAMRAAGMSVFDVEEIPTHGGSIRVYAQHRSADSLRPPESSVDRLLATEIDRGITSIDPYVRFASEVPRIKQDLLEFLIGRRRSDQRIVGYGAPGKANTLLNYCGIRTDLIDFLVDRNPYKHGRFTPGTHIPILPPEALVEVQPDVVIIMPWNLVKEISEQLAYTRKWGCELMTVIPTVQPV